MQPVYSTFRCNNSQLSTTEITFVRTEMTRRTLDTKETISVKDKKIMHKSLNIHECKLEICTMRKKELSVDHLTEPEIISCCRSHEGTDVPFLDGPVSVSHAQSRNDASRFLVSWRLFRFRLHLSGILLYKVFHSFLSRNLYKSI